ncbi:hypothetical protein A2U01_0056657, partial [Trifolium medium]|nr:hypothetical protein [Trifolium medium]
PICAQRRNQKLTSPNRATLRAAQITPARNAANRRKQEQQPHCCAQRRSLLRAAQPTKQNQQHSTLTALSAA